MFTTILRESRRASARAAPPDANGTLDADSQPRGGRSREGFTILEVTIGAVLVAILAAGVLSSLTMAHISDRSAQDIITSQNLAQDVLESIAITPFPGLLGLDASTVVDGRFTATISTSTVAIGLVRVEVLVSCADNPDINTRVVTLVSDVD